MLKDKAEKKHGGKKIQCKNERIKKTNVRRTNQETSAIKSERGETGAPTLFSPQFSFTLKAAPLIIATCKTSKRASAREKEGEGGRVGKREAGC